MTFEIVGVKIKSSPLCSYHAAIVLFCSEQKRIAAHVHCCLGALLSIQQY